MGDYNLKRKRGRTSIENYRLDQEKEKRNGFAFMERKHSTVPSHPYASKTLREILRANNEI